MKIAIPTNGRNLDSSLDGRFGRAERFLIVDSETDAFVAIENDQKEASQGAGIQSAQAVIGASAQALVSSHCGPKAFKVLQAAKVPVLQCDIGSIRDILAQVRAGTLVELGGPDRAGHGG